MVICSTISLTTTRIQRLEVGNLPNTDMYIILLYHIKQNRKTFLKTTFNQRQPYVLRKCLQVQHEAQNTFQLLYMALRSHKPVVKFGQSSVRPETERSRRPSLRPANADSALLQRMDLQPSSQVHCYRQQASF